MEFQNSQIMERMISMFMQDEDDSSEVLTRYTDKSFLIAKHEGSVDSSIYNIELINGAASFMFKTSVSTGIPATNPHPIQLCPKSLVSIRNLMEEPGERMNGKFFLCRTIAPPFQMTSIMTIVDDPEGQLAVRIALYNYPSSGNILEDLPVGVILAICNPWFKFTADGGLTVRCDNPAEVIILSDKVFKDKFPNLEWRGEVPELWRSLQIQIPNTAKEWKSKGNKMYLAKNYAKAIQFYTSGLELEPGDICLQSNRAAAYLALGCYNKSLEDCEIVLGQDPSHPKAIYRKANSLLGLQQIPEAIAFIEANITQLDSANKKTLGCLLRKTNVFSKQQNKGEYDFLQLHSYGDVSQEVADYVGPVKVAEVPGKGRGTFATSEVQPGQLIMASKAFAIIIPDQNRSKTIEMNINLETKYMNTVDQRQLVDKIAQKLCLDPKLSETVYPLYAGPDLSIYQDEGSGASSQCLNLDLKRIEAICTFNEFGTTHSKNQNEKFQDFVRGTKTGLWILPSYINHSCWDCNCSWTLFGDLMVIRAFKRIDKGEEILIPYISPTKSYQEREEYLEKHGFVCQCGLCVLDRNHSKDGRKRAKKLFEIRQAHEFKKFTKLMKLIDGLDDSAYGTLKLYPSLALPLTELGNEVGLKSKNFEKAIQYLIRCREAVKDSPLMELSLQATINIIGSFLILGRKEEAEKWVPVLKTELLIGQGTLDMAEVYGPTTIPMLKNHGIPFK